MESIKEGVKTLKTSPLDLPLADNYLLPCQWQMKQEWSYGMPPSQNSSLFKIVFCAVHDMSYTLPDHWAVRLISLGKRVFILVASYWSNGKWQEKLDFFCVLIKQQYFAQKIGSDEPMKIRNNSSVHCRLTTIWWHCVHGHGALVVPIVRHVRRLTYMIHRH